MKNEFSSSGGVISARIKKAKREARGMCYVFI